MIERKIDLSMARFAGSARQLVFDAAMLSELQPSVSINEPNRGGIDLNPNLFELIEQGQAIEFNLNDTFLENVPSDAIEGIVPVIINISPITNFMPLLGKSPR